jgi:multidrug resistance efflux pump
VKKGDVLFKIDPTPYQNDVKSLEARLAAEEAKVGAERARLNEAEAKLSDAVSGERQLLEQLNEATAQVGALNASLELARKRVAQNTELVSTGAGNRFDLEQAQSDLQNLQAQLNTALAQEAQVQAQLAAVVDGDIASIARLKADLATAEWELEQTTVVSPCECFVINLQLRPGAFVAGVPFNPVMTLVEAEGQVVALFYQNELHQVEPGNEAEFVLKTYPGRVIKGTVDSIIWAQGAGQMPASGSLPMTGVLAQPPNRFAVKFNIDSKDRDLFLAAGAAGSGAIYTEGFAFLHIIRKVILRVGAYTDYLILKLH